MAKRVEKKTYIIQGVPTTIAARVKITTKIGDHFVSVEGYEERTLSDDPDINMPREWNALYEDVFTQCDDESANIIADMTGKSTKRRK